MCRRSLGATRHSVSSRWTPSFTPVWRTAACGILSPGGIPFIHRHKLITRRLREALALIDVRVLDHRIVAGSDVTSLSERGLI
jgi:hypothetical protein